MLNRNRLTAAKPDKVFFAEDDAGQLSNGRGQRQQSRPGNSRVGIQRNGRTFLEYADSDSPQVFDKGATAKPLTKVTGQRPDVGSLGATHFQVQMGELKIQQANFIGTDAAWRQVDVLA